VTLPPLTYLTTDSLAEGVGASQVLAYLDRLVARGLDVRLHTFEKQAPPPTLLARVRSKGIRWSPHQFGRLGAAGGVGRVTRGARAVRGAELVHARSDMPAASAMLARCPTFIWDVRSLWADQRIALGTLRPGSPEHRVFQRVEGAAARRSSGIVTLTAAVLPVLDGRYDGVVSSKSQIIPTCVDLRAFPLTDAPPGPPWRLLLAGTLNTYYDVPLMVRFVSVGQRRRRAELELLSPTATTWDDVLEPVTTRRGSATPAEMPQRLQACHVGLSVCRRDAGVSLTGSMPTKIAEFLASGRPVVVNPGLGDADRMVEASGAGIVLRDPRDEGLEAAWDALEDLLADPATPQRCRDLAEAHFDLEKAADSLMTMYERVWRARG
jgi:glycosyltransferase involved in cell wall biosynthesis